MSQNQNFKGILVEVDYRPCLVPALCWDLMREFMQGFLGQHAPSTIPTFFTNSIPAMMNPAQHYQKFNDTYQPIDTVQQYLEHFNSYRKQTPNQTSVMMGGPRN